MKRLLLAFTLVASAAGAQTVYRCGDGKQYSQTPCPGGKAVVADDARSPDQQRQAAAAARADAQRANALATERREREAAAKGQLAAGIKPPAAAASAAKPHAKPKKKPRTRNAEPADDKLSAPVKAPVSPKKGKVAKAA